MKATGASPGVKDRARLLHHTFTQVNPSRNLPAHLSVDETRRAIATRAENSVVYAAGATSRKAHEALPPQDLIDASRVTYGHVRSRTIPSRTMRPPSASAETNVRSPSFAVIQARDRVIKSSARAPRIK